MEEGQKVFIRGVNGRGNELIETLVELGAKDKGFCDYNREEFIYFINHDGYIDSINPNCELGKIIMDNYHELKLPELWKDGDILVDNDTPNRFVVKMNVWTGPWKNHFKTYLVVNPTHINESPIAIFCNTDYHKADSEELRKFHDLLHEHGKEWDSEKKQLVDWKWKPKEGEEYFFIGNTLEINSFPYNGETFDKELLSIGNCFHTREEAKVIVERIRKILNGK